MAMFWVVAAFLLAGALLFLLPPLAGWGRDGARPALRDATLAVYRDRLGELDADLANGALATDRYQESRAELARLLMAELGEPLPAASRPPPVRPTLALLGVALPLAALALYWQLGTPAALRQATAEAPVAGHALTQAQMLDMMARLANRLKANPGDAAGWGMLGRSYIAIGRLNDAVLALERAYALTPDDPQLLVDYADVMGALQNKNLSGRPAELIRKALDLNPTHPKALALAGTVAFNESQFDLAVHYWERLIALFPPGSPQAQGIARSIAEARGKGAGQASQSGAAIAGTVAVSPALAGRVAPGATLFVYAKALQGPPMPLAVLRLPARDFPLRFRLDDRMAMAPGLKLSNFDRVEVGARVSRAGSAIPQSGDLEGRVAPVARGSEVALTIDRVVP